MKLYIQQGSPYRDDYMSRKLSVSELTDENGEVVYRGFIGFYHAWAKDENTNLVWFVGPLTITYLE